MVDHACLISKATSYCNFLLLHCASHHDSTSAQAQNMCREVSLYLKKFLPVSNSRRQVPTAKLLAASDRSQLGRQVGGVGASEHTQDRGLGTVAVISNTSLYGTAAATGLLLWLPALQLSSTGCPDPSMHGHKVPCCSCFCRSLTSPGVFEEAGTCCAAVSDAAYSGVAAVYQVTSTHAFTACRVTVRQPVLLTAAGGALQLLRRFQHSWRVLWQQQARGCRSDAALKEGGRGRCGALHIPKPLLRGSAMVHTAIHLQRVFTPNLTGKQQG